MWQTLSTEIVTKSKFLSFSITINPSSAHCQAPGASPLDLPTTPGSCHQTFHSHAAKSQGKKTGMSCPQKFIVQAGTSLSVCQHTVLSCQCLLPLRRLSVLIMMALGREPLWSTQDWEAGSLLHMPTVTHGDCESINLQLLWPHVQVLQPKAKAPVTTTKVKGNEGEHCQDTEYTSVSPRKTLFSCPSEPTGYFLKTTHYPDKLIWSNLLFLGLRKVLHWSQIRNRTTAFLQYRKAQAGNSCQIHQAPYSIPLPRISFKTRSDQCFSSHTFLESRSYQNDVSTHSFTYP